VSFKVRDERREKEGGKEVNEKRKMSID